VTCDRRQARIGSMASWAKVVRRDVDMANFSRQKVRRKRRDYNADAASQPPNCCTAAMTKAHDLRPISATIGR
jgi:hypothetical protein